MNADEQGSHGPCPRGAYYSVKNSKKKDNYRKQNPLPFNDMTSRNSGLTYLLSLCHTISFAGCSSFMSNITVTRASLLGPLFAPSATSSSSDVDLLQCACDVSSLDL